MKAKGYTLILLVMAGLLWLWVDTATAVLSPFRNARQADSQSSGLSIQNTRLAPLVSDITPTWTPLQPAEDEFTPVQWSWVANLAPTMPPGMPGLIPSPTPSPTPTPPPGAFAGLDFSDRQKRVRITIYPPDRQVNQGKPITLIFYPGDACLFGDQRACINTFQTLQGGSATFITVHSGLGGQAERFRQAVEGSGINQAGFGLSKVNKNLRALQGARVEIKQGGTIVDGFVLKVVARLPAGEVAGYMQTPAAGALDFALQLDPGLAEQLDLSQPLLIFETCGWKMPGEPWAEGVSATSASIYLGVIQAAR